MRVFTFRTAFELFFFVVVVVDDGIYIFDSWIENGLSEPKKLDLLVDEYENV